MSGPVEMYVEFGSPYACLGVLQIEEVAKKHGREVEFKPYLLGIVFKETGTTTPAANPLKRDYLLTDFPRAGREIGFNDMKLPEGFPVNTVPHCRAFYFIQEKHGNEKANEFLKHTIRFMWQGGDTTSPEKVAALAGEIGLDAGEVLAGMGEDAIKDKVKQVTAEAMQRGVFGAPWTFIDGEPFWGSDRIGQIDRWLEKGGW